MMLMTLVAAEAEILDDDSAGRARCSSNAAGIGSVKRAQPEKYAGEAVVHQSPLAPTVSMWCNP